MISIAGSFLTLNCAHLNLN